MRLSDNGRKLIQGFEGYSSKAYPDADGYSIGYGHFLGKDPSLASRTVSRDEAERLFDQDVLKFETAVAMTTPNAAQHEFDAMTSLAYNIGTAGFAGSTVARKHNMGDRAGAADAFLLWNKSQGAVHQGLVKRRAREREIYLGGYSTPGTFPTPLPPMSTPSTPPVATAPSGSAWPSPETPGYAIAPGSSTITRASVVSIAAIALGWLLHRLISH